MPYYKNFRWRLILSECHLRFTVGPFIIDSTPTNIPCIFGSSSRLHNPVWVRCQMYNQILFILSNPTISVAFWEHIVMWNDLQTGLQQWKPRPPNPLYSPLTSYNYFRITYNDESPGPQGWGPYWYWENALFLSIKKSLSRTFYINLNFPIST